LHLHHAPALLSQIRKLDGSGSPGANASGKKNAAAEAAASIVTSVAALLQKKNLPEI
jgi:hypothetical protein